MSASEGITEFPQWVVLPLLINRSLRKCGLVVSLSTAVEPQRRQPHADDDREHRPGDHRRAIPRRPSARGGLICWCSGGGTPQMFLVCSCDACHATGSSGSNADTRHGYRRRPKCGTPRRGRATASSWPHRVHDQYAEAALGIREYFPISLRHRRANADPLHERSVIGRTSRNWRNQARMLILIQGMPSPN